MASSKVIIITGASRGMGLAMAKYLLKEGHRLVLVARTEEPLQELKKQYPDRMEFISGDLSDYALTPFLSLPAHVIAVTLSRFERLDGLVVNHGTLGDVKRISDSAVEEWRSVFDTNFFSAMSFVRESVEHLRDSNGSIIFVSSGAATGAYSTWGAYGASKAAINHLALTLSVEEPLVTSIAIRPGTVDTAMQKAIREEYGGRMDEKDLKKFADLHSKGELLKPEQPGHVMAKLVLEAPKNLSGKFLSWNDPALKCFQEA